MVHGGECKTVATGLLSLQDSQRLVRELKVWSDQERQVVAGAMQVLFDHWRADWSAHNTAGGGAPLQVLDAIPLEPGLLNNREAQQTLHAVMFGEALVVPDRNDMDQGGGDMALQLSALAWTALSKKVADLSGMDIGAASSHPPQPWSGELVVVVSWGEHSWAIRFNAAAVERLLGSTGITGKAASAVSFKSRAVTLTPLAHALERRLVTVRADLTFVSLSLGQLQALALGDVIALDHPLEQPALLVLHEGNSSVTLCTAWLGQTAGRMSVELQPLPSVSASSY